MKKHLRWLENFQYAENASLIFLNEMDQQLKLKFELICKTGFFLKYLDASPEDARHHYDKEKNETLLNVFISVNGYECGECAITWRHTKEKRMVLPSEEIQAGDVVFDWVNLNLNNLKIPTSAEKISLKKVLGLDVSFEIEFDSDGFSSDFTLEVELLNPKEAADLEQFMSNYINSWSKSNREYLINDFGEDKIEDGQPIYFLNTGRSDPFPILKAIFESFEQSKIGIKQIVLENI